MQQQSEGQYFGKKFHYLIILSLFCSSLATRPRQHAGIILRWLSSTSLWVRHSFLHMCYLWLEFFYSDTMTVSPDNSWHCWMAISSSFEAVCLKQSSALHVVAVTYINLHPLVNLFCHFCLSFFSWPEQCAIFGLPHSHEAQTPAEGSLL